jgi:hypothetical protein
MMSKNQQILVYGYHGTSSENAQSIVREGFRVSKNEYDWLGKGIYFWQDAPGRAWSWARHQHQNPAVICAEISINLDFSIDLFDSFPDNVYLMALKQSYKRFRDLLSTTELIKQRGGFHGLDRVVVDYVADTLVPELQNKQIQVIRSVFIEGEPIFPSFGQNEKSAFHDKSHVQIAVRDSSVIKNLCQLENQLKG